MAQVLEYNHETGESIVRDLTQEEIDDLAASATEQAAKVAAEQAILDAKKAVLEKLGLTEDEAKALLA